jgi:hypothetical protein
MLSAAVAAINYRPRRLARLVAAGRNAYQTRL